jgi:hypothetical protein
MLVNRLRYRARKQITIDRKRRSGRHACDLGRVHDKRIEPPHLLFEESDGIVELVAAKRIAADQLGESIGFVDFCRPRRPHFVDGDRNAAGGSLPRRLTACKAATNDADRA